MDEVIHTGAEIPGFSMRTAHYLACASFCAYEEPDDWVRKLGLKQRIAPFTCGQFHGFVGSLGELMLLAFRGTESVGNCLTDAETPLVSREPYSGRVHQGFAGAVETVWADVTRLLGAPWRCPPLWITGHSLGGAMATLSSVRLASEGYVIRAVYTYGSPRAGDERFHDCYRLANYRFVNDDDLVPHLPFRWCYKHVGRLELVDSQGGLLEQMEAWQEKKRILAAKAKRVQRAHRGRHGTHREFDDFDWLADHRIGSYLGAIGKILPRVPHLRRPNLAANTSLSRLRERDHEPWCPG